MPLYQCVRELQPGGLQRVIAEIIPAVLVEAFRGGAGGNRV